MKRTRFLEDLRFQMSSAIREKEKLEGFRYDRSKDSAEYAYGAVLRALDDPNTKRVLFDARQAALFVESGELDVAVRVKMQPFFNQFYLEFTEPVRVLEGEGGEEYMRAILYSRDTAEIPMLKSTTGEVMEHIPVTSMTVFLTEHRPDKGTIWIDRTIRVMDGGIPLVRIKDCVSYAGDRGSMDWPEWQKDRYDTPLRTDISRFPEHVKLDGSPDSYIVACRPVGDTEEAELDILHGGTATVRFAPGEDEQEGRYYGWWERSARHYVEILYWIFAYTMAKSVKIIEATPSRQERRWHERKRRPLQPWHYVKVEPKFSSAHPVQEGIGAHQSYRYDVIGHLRFNKHHRYSMHTDRNSRGTGGVCPGEECFNYVVEVVPPHQRGLQNTIYIPKTYGVERGKVVSKAMKVYLGKEVAL